MQREYEGSCLQYLVVLAMKNHCPSMPEESYFAACSDLCIGVLVHHRDHGMAMRLRWAHGRPLWPPVDLKGDIGLGVREFTTFTHSLCSGLL